MKKNKMLRLASVLLVLTLLTTSIIGGTFAKYTSSGSVRDTARVAKWGVEIKTSGSLYSDAYAKGAGNLPAAWTEVSPSADSITVAAATQNDNIVAPGTESYGNGLSFGIAGTPEVAVTVKTIIEAEDIYLKEGTYGVLVPATVSDTESLKKVVNKNTDGVYKAGTDNSYTKVTEDSALYATGDEYYILTNKVDLTGDYFPVVYTLGGSTSTGGADEKTAVKIAKKLAGMLETNPTTDGGETDYKVSYKNITHKYPANTDLGSSGPKFGNENLKWKWEFENANKDRADTILGDLIAAKKDKDSSKDVDYKFVSIGNDGAVTELAIGTGDDFTVKAGTDVVANLRTMFDISLNVTQVD